MQSIALRFIYRHTVFPTADDCSLYQDTGTQAIYPNLSYSVARDMAPIMFTRHHIIEVMAEVNCMASRASSITCMSALLMRSASQKGPSR